MLVLVLAKAPQAGRVKTRLCPPLTPAQAAEIAEAALADTLSAVAGCGATRRVVALDGAPGPWLPPGFEVIAQRGHGFAERLTAAWNDVGGPGLQIGMDTPQLSAGDLDTCLATLHQPGIDAVLGPAYDGGWWAIGLHRADARVFRGVPMSTPVSGVMQRARLAALGLRVAPLAPRRDLDRPADALAIAAAFPHTAPATAAAVARCFAAIGGITAPVGHA